MTRASCCSVAALTSAGAATLAQFASRRPLRLRHPAPSGTTSTRTESLSCWTPGGPTTLFGTRPMRTTSPNRRRGSVERPPFGIEKPARCRQTIDRGPHLAQRRVRSVDLAQPRRCAGFLRPPPAQEGPEPPRARLRPEAVTEREKRETCRLGGDEQGVWSWCRGQRRCPP